jgi:membrane protein DedA with SNARE-associated domain
MEALLHLVREHHGAWSLVAVFAGAALEYLIPPLPADSILLAASLLIVAGAYPFAWVTVVAVAGGAAGSLVHYGLGRLLSLPDGGVRGERHFERLFGRGSFDRFSAAFRRWGMWAIVVNRALPGVRAVTFLAAGASRLPVWKTMLAGLVSNVGWTIAILTLGVSVGESYEKIEAAFRVYETVVYSMGAVLALVVLVWWIRRR